MGQPRSRRARTSGSKHDPGQLELPINFGDEKQVPLTAPVPDSAVPEPVQPAVPPPAPPATAPDFTPTQREAIAARGNILLAAGAGTGKTKTLVERCVRLLLDPEAQVSAEDVLVVTFTEAAAAELRARLRAALLERQLTDPANAWLAGQICLLDVAHIGTLHSFCFNLVRDHFHELELDPQLAILRDGADRLLMESVFEDLLRPHYAGSTEADADVRRLLELYDSGGDGRVRDLVLKLHRYTQTLPNPHAWLEAQLEWFRDPHAARWEELFGEAVALWRDNWLPELRELGVNRLIAECIQLLEALEGTELTRASASAALTRVVDIFHGDWPRGDKGAIRDEVKRFWREAEFLHSLLPTPGQPDPLAQDWEWVSQPMIALLNLTREFTATYAERKRHLAQVDFHDLEQFALRLLWNAANDSPTPLALRLRERFKFVFVDEYQDINTAQDAILRALSREGAAANRFLVGDVKQSIYRFRLAAPAIFRRYQRDWNLEGGPGIVLHLSENFRSRPRLLDFINALFPSLMREELGGLVYDAPAALRPGPRSPRFNTACVDADAGTAPRVEFHLVVEEPDAPSAGQANGDSDVAETDAQESTADLERAEKEARVLARRFRELHEAGHLVWDDALDTTRPVRWSDMVILLRAVRGRADGYAREFERAGVPLQAPQGGFFDAAEIGDMLSLLQLLDNSLQDIPTLAVLRSPLVGLNLDELAQVRLAVSGTLFWNALTTFHSRKSATPLWEKVDHFLTRFQRWRKLSHEMSIAAQLEQILVDTGYADWLLTQPDGARRVARLRRLVILAREFDPAQRQGLRRFLDFVKAQRDTPADREVPAVRTADAVQLMTIHASKGLEFPVVALADLSSRFNLRDLSGDLIFDERLGVCPKVIPPQSDAVYASLPHWLAAQHERAETLGEEIRLLYVAMTRARDTLILVGSTTDKARTNTWSSSAAEYFNSRRPLRANSPLDWLGRWLCLHVTTGQGQLWDTAAHGTTSLCRWHVHQGAGQSVPSTTTAAAAGPAPDLSPEDEASLEQLRARLDFQYPHLAATQISAKSTVTRLRQSPAVGQDDTFDEATADRSFSLRPRSGGNLSAEETGLAHHRFLEHVRFDHTGSLDSLRAEATRLVREGILTKEDHDALDLPALLAFWESPVGRDIRAHSNHAHREMSFTARFTLAELASALSQREREGVRENSSLAGDFIVVQGTVDLALILPGEIRIVDFKTGHIPPGGLSAKVAEYAPQLKLYASALARIHQRPVSSLSLHFLAVGETVPVEPPHWPPTL